MQREGEGRKQRRLESITVHKLQLQGPQPEERTVVDHKGRRKGGNTEARGYNLTQVMRNFEKKCGTNNRESWKK